MSRKTIERLLKSLIPMGGAMLLYACIWLIPDAMRFMALYWPEFRPLVTPTILFGWAVALPIGAAMCIAYRIFHSIGHDQSFTFANAKRMRWISMLAFADFILLLIGFAATLPINIAHPIFLLCFTVAGFLCLAAAVCCLVLSKLLRQAAELKEESDLTI